MATDDPQQGNVLSTVIDQDGRYETYATLGSPGCSGDHMYIGNSQAIPIVFLPGIMGSPLIATGNNAGTITSKVGNNWAWFPDSLPWLGLSIGEGYRDLDAVKRKTLLDPDNTRAVARPQDADISTWKGLLDKHAFVHLDEAMRRGWGSVLCSGYGDFMLWLEYHLEHLYFEGRPHAAAAYKRTDAKAWGEVKGYEAVTDAELVKAANWRYPVYAVGYNWLQSNKDSAQKVVQRIAEIKADCQQRLKLKCDKVIVVTHSMGGLVGRMAAKLAPDLIWGVVHGVQPATGAGTAYQHVREGYADLVGSMVIGGSGDLITPIFANASGCLELLPNQQYGPGWMVVNYQEFGTPRKLFSLPDPGGSPYAQIYANGDQWWRLMHPGLVDPGTKDLSASWGNYIARLRVAEAFHTELADHYHPTTYAYYGASSNKKAWKKINWNLVSLSDMSTGVSAKAPSADVAKNGMTLTRDDLQSFAEIQNKTSAGLIMYAGADGVGRTANYSGDAYRARIGVPDDEGDGTVPAHSGSALTSYVRFCARMTGFDHQGSYANDAVRSLTLHSVIKIAQQAVDLC